MTPREALRQRVLGARRFRYIPDPSGADYAEALANDRWETANEVEARGGADCDGLAVHCVVRAYDDVLMTGAPLGTWALVAGEVLQRGTWRGHMWVEWRDDESTLWCDPTWGWLPDRPEALGYAGNRKPIMRYLYDGIIFSRAEAYTA